jgi:cyclopropane fatty-acyl-phospholipid synthase-like methyltransferase
MTIAEHEQEKYRLMWQVPSYRGASPGERLVPMFLELAQWDKGDELIDCGAGTGRASKLLADAGLDVTMLDITKTAADPGIQLPFIEACLWDMAEVWPGRFDWVYCCDVLEHIPTDHVDDVLDNLTCMSGYGAFMNIALFHEIHGPRFVGEHLHLTVKPADWWLSKIKQRWECNHIEVSDDPPSLLVLTGEAK